MPLNPELIRIAACPKCKGPVEVKADESGFTCERCRLLYPVVDDIPNFIVAEAEPLGD